MTKSTLACPVRAAARSHAAEPALVADGAPISYGTLDRAVGRACARFVRAGVQPGDAVAVAMRDGPLSAVYLFALLRLGGVFVPLGRRLPAREVEARARRAGCRFWLSDDNRAVPDGFTRLQTTDDDLLRAISDSAVRGSAGKTGGEWAPNELPEPIWLDPARPATVLFTSGSTGTARGVQHRLVSHRLSALGSAENIALVTGDVWALSLSLGHVGGLAVLFRTVFSGAAARFVSPADLGNLLAAGGASHVSMVYTQLKRQLSEGVKPEGLKAVLVGGSAVEPEVIQQARARGWPVHTTYGSTEMASQITASAPGAGGDELQTSGRSLPFREVRIRKGEIEVRGPVRFDGYVEDDGLDRPFDPDGWFATGDLGRLDANGCLVVHGRSDGLFVTGGENVQPEMIEAAIREAGLAKECVVVSVPDEEYGRRPVAFVRPHPTTADQLERWRKRLLDAMPSYAVPDCFLPLPDHIDTVVSKVDRKALEHLAKRRSGP